MDSPPSRGMTQPKTDHAAVSKKYLSLVQLGIQEFDDPVLDQPLQLSGGNPPPRVRVFGPPAPDQAVADVVAVPHTLLAGMCRGHPLAGPVMDQAHKQAGRGSRDACLSVHPVRGES